MNQERINKLPPLSAVVDHFRLMGTIFVESLKHPTRTTTIVYDEQTRGISVKVEEAKKPSEKNQ